MMKYLFVILVLAFFIIPAKTFAFEGTFAAPTSWDSSGGQFLFNSGSFSPTFVGDCGNNTPFGFVLFTTPVV